ncbi:hypothetical protein EJB05_24138, partial [Eragrostis curvula]
MQARVAVEEERGRKIEWLTDGSRSEIEPGPREVIAQTQEGTCDVPTLLSVLFSAIFYVS